MFCYCWTVNRKKGHPAYTNLLQLSLRLSSGEGQIQSNFRKEASWVAVYYKWATDRSDVHRVVVPALHAVENSAEITAYTHPFNGPFLGLPTWASSRKVKPIWILLEQETVSGSGISWAICKSAPCSRQITTPAPHRSVFYRPDALPAAQPTASKHWRLISDINCNN